ncbi:DUF3488 and transglutaminase-like domain-containing protein [Curvibacter sp. APW13]|uniref:transglutaminase family protein n=1 Tax=Curvibacter sp. APW13 TaxID=3077236 RepID=UPI0028DEC123|nr:DUF3488 and transglutaminase-like domain-containing protein [Curvibacter sp. APW13]MDT8992036.1 DUF3488 and transglutaminase-like domain-containing protein [Curvibacter sp. APW13]
MAFLSAPATLRQLPRDTRDTWFLLAVIGWTIAPHFEHLPLWCSAMAVTLLLWRGRIAWHAHPLPSRWWLLALLVVAVGATLFSHRTLLGRDPGVTLIVVLLALKTLEMRARRDAFVIFFLSFFTLLSNFFFSQSLLTAAAMLLSLLGLLTALVNSHLPVGRPPLWQSARTALWMALLGAPIMALLFMFFPRIAPLWGMPGDAMAGRSGLSGQMKVGSVTSLALDGSVAFRVEFLDKRPPQRELYFRGPVLTQFDGREWRAGTADPFTAPAPAALAVEGTAYPYRVTLEAHQRPWLLTLDATPEAPKLPDGRARMQNDLQWFWDRPVTELLRYEATAYPAFRHGPARAHPGLQEARSLPPGSNPRTQALAQELRRSLGERTDTPTLIEAVLTRLRTGGYTYTLEPGEYGEHTADEFWFDRKQGFCEHIASSFVILMRALGVPARIVTGYQGGEINGLDGFFTVRQSDAHAWAEVWVANQGWVRVDPTGAVAPGRTGSFQPLRAPSGALTNVVVTVSPALAAQLRALWDATNNRWNQWVLNYSQAKQLDLLRSLGVQTPRWEDLVYVLAGLVFAAGALGALWSAWERSRQDPWLRLLHQAQRRLQKLGLPVHSATTAQAMARWVKEQAWGHDAAGQALVHWLQALEQQRYAPSPAAQSLATLRSQWRHLAWPAQR